MGVVLRTDKIYGKLLKYHAFEKCGILDIRLYVNFLSLLLDSFIYAGSRSILNQTSSVPLEHSQWTRTHSSSELTLNN